MKLKRSVTILIGLLACALLAFAEIRAESSTISFNTEQQRVKNLEQQRVFNIEQQRVFNSEQQQILKSIAPAKIIYLGESHDSASDHADQLAILDYLRQQQSVAKPRLAIGLEMFQKPYQPIIDQYLAGKISEVQLVQQTEYPKRWGWPWENYAPLLRFAKTHQIPVIALNTPTEILRKVVKGGLDSLQSEDLQYIPPVAEIDKSNLIYRDLILESYRQHKAQALTTSPDFDRFYSAQLLWDETMAATTAKFYRKNPKTQLVVIAGQAHIRYGYGIPSRVARRLAKIPYTQKSVILSSDEKWDKTIADYLFRPI